MQTASVQNISQSFVHIYSLVEVLGEIRLEFTAA